MRYPGFFAVRLDRFTGTGSSGCPTSETHAHNSSTYCIGDLIVLTDAECKAVSKTLARSCMSCSSVSLNGVIAIHELP